MSHTRRHALALIAGLPLVPMASRAAEADVIDARVDLALARLFREVGGAEDLAARALGMLIMPKVVKGGFIIGGSYGEGALRLNRDEAGYGPTEAYYSVAAASIGLQAGLQETSHVLFFLTDAALARFRRADGWEVGADAEVTLLDKAVNLDINSTAFEKPVVAIVFGGSGILIGASLEGAKYSLIAR